MLEAAYDKSDDVLYLSKGSPVGALTEQEDDGLLLRRSLDTDEPVGITVVMYQRWRPYRQKLIRRISELLSVEQSEASRVLPPMHK